MSVPPDPHLPAAIIEAARALGWRAVPDKGDLGSLYDPAAPQWWGGRSDPHVLHIVGAGPGVVAWHLGILPFWAPAVLMQEATASMLSAATAERDGSFTFEGKCYRLRASLWGGVLAAIPEEVGVCF